MRLIFLSSLHLPDAPSAILSPSLTLINSLSTSSGVRLISIPREMRTLLAGPVGSPPGFSDPACLHCDDECILMAAVFVHKPGYAHCTNVCNTYKDRNRYIIYMNAKNIISMKAMWNVLIQVTG